MRLLHAAMQQHVLNALPATPYEYDIDCGWIDDTANELRDSAAHLSIGRLISYNPRKVYPLLTIYLFMYMMKPRFLGRVKSSESRVWRDLFKAQVTYACFIISILVSFDKENPCLLTYFKGFNRQAEIPTAFRYIFRLRCQRLGRGRINILYLLKPDEVFRNSEGIWMNLGRVILVRYESLHLAPLPEALLWVVRIKFYKWRDHPELHRQLLYRHTWTKRNKS